MTTYPALGAFEDRHGSSARGRVMMMTVSEQVCLASSRSVTCDEWIALIDDRTSERSADHDVLQAAARNEALSAPTARRTLGYDTAISNAMSNSGSRNGCPEVRYLLAQHQHIDDYMSGVIFRSTDFAMHLALAKNPHTGPKVALTLREHTDPLVRIALAANRRAHIDTLAFLADDEDADVRREVWLATRTSSYSTHLHLAEALAHEFADSEDTATIHREWAAAARARS